MSYLLRPSTTEAPFAWSLPVRPIPGRHRNGTSGDCWKATLADLLDQALTVDAFTEAARQAFGETCTVVPPGEGVSMQQIVPPQRIIITSMVNDMVTEACCY
jgi:hypothetical protein